MSDNLVPLGFKYTVIGVTSTGRERVELKLDNHANLTRLMRKLTSGQAGEFVNFIVERTKVTAGRNAKASWPVLSGASRRSFYARNKKKEGKHKKVALAFVFNRQEYARAIEKGGYYEKLRYPVTTTVYSSFGGYRRPKRFIVKKIAKATYRELDKGTLAARLEKHATSAWKNEVKRAKRNGAI